MSDNHEAFEAIVGTRLRHNEAQAIAQATQRLANPDHVQGHVARDFVRSDVFDVNVYGGGDEQYGVGLVFAVEDAHEHLLESLEAHPKVESVERVHYEVMDA